MISGDTNNLMQDISDYLALSDTLRAEGIDPQYFSEYAEHDYLCDAGILKDHPKLIEKPEIIGVANQPGRIRNNFGWGYRFPGMQ